VESLRTEALGEIGAKAPRKKRKPRRTRRRGFPCAIGSRSGRLSRSGTLSGLDRRPRPNLKHRDSIADALEFIGRGKPREAGPDHVLSKRDVVPGKIVEHGAELIGFNHLAWLSYARKFKLKLDKIRESKNPAPVVLGGQLLSPSRATMLAKQMFKGERLFNDAARSVDAYEPWETPNAKKLDRICLATGLKRL
jgi:hypothetical protein